MSATGPKTAEQSTAELGPLSVEVREDGVALITYDVPGETMNTLRDDFVAQFTRVFADVENNPDVRASVLLSGKKHSFIAGADISMLSRISGAREAREMVRQGHQAIGRLASARKPVVAAIHGAALGGGFEVALACHGRVLSHTRKTVLGLPEVKLGLLPGLNGLQRLSAIAGLQVALDYGLTGKNLRPDKARKLGIADDVVPRPILTQVAAELALHLASRNAPKRNGFALDQAHLTQLALEKNPLGRKVLFKKARAEVLANTGGHYPAPERIIDVLESLFTIFS